MTDAQQAALDALVRSWCGPQRVTVIDGHAVHTYPDDMTEEELELGLLMDPDQPTEEQ